MKKIKLLSVLSLFALGSLGTAQAMIGMGDVGRVSALDKAEITTTINTPERVAELASKPVLTPREKAEVAARDAMKPVEEVKKVAVKHPDGSVHFEEVRNTYKLSKMVENNVLAGIALNDYFMKSQNKGKLVNEQLFKNEILKTMYNTKLLVNFKPEDRKKAKENYGTFADNLVKFTDMQFRTVTINGKHFTKIDNTIPQEYCERFLANFFQSEHIYLFLDGYHFKPQDNGYLLCKGKADQKEVQISIAFKAEQIIKKK